MIDGKYVKTLDNWIFQNCTNITSLEISYGIKNIGIYEFYGCTNISGNVDIPKSINDLGAASFYNCKNIRNLNIDCNSILRYESGFATFENCTSLENVTISNNVLGVEEYMFRGSNLSGVMKIECSGEIKGSAFRDIQGNGSIELNGENVTSIGNFAFYRNTLLTSVTLSNKCKNLGTDTFQRCTNLKNVYLDCDSDIGVNCFYNCTNLKTVYISNNVKNIGENAFYGCAVSELLEIHNKGIIKNSAFRSIKGVGKIKLDFSNITSIEDYAFSDIELTGEVKIPNNVKQLGVAIFERATNITKLWIDCDIIPDKAPGGQGFCRNCTNLKEVYIGKNVTKIGSIAFGSCDIVDVYYYGSLEQWNELKKAIGANNQALLNANIYYNYAD